ncbi:EF-hand protein [Cytidiella melzeri]|nr:EF-hand protein [Cytidiella melzeri]
MSSSGSRTELAGTGEPAGGRRNEYKYREAFALFDKKGTGAVPRDVLGDLLRALGQNPTQAEVSDIVSSSPQEVDYKTFLTILNRPDGFKPAGTPEEFIRGFQVFDKEGNGFIGAGELRYVLTQLGEKMTDAEVDELLKGVQIGADGNVNYESFVRTILSQ